jgi:hypothetical protein
MDSLLPDVAPLARFRLPRITALLLCVSLLSRTSVQGSNGPLKVALKNNLCTPKLCPGNRDSVGVQLQRAEDRFSLPQASNQPPSSARSEPASLSDWIDRDPIASGRYPLADKSIDGPGALLAPAPWLDPGREETAVPGGGAPNAAAPSFQTITQSAHGSAVQGDPGARLSPFSPARLTQNPSATQLDEYLRAGSPVETVVRPIRDYGPVSVPGPLPVLGLVTALAYCRQFRYTMARRKKPPSGIEIA